MFLFCCSFSFFIVLIIIASDVGAGDTGDASPSKFSWQKFGKIWANLGKI